MNDQTYDELNAFLDKMEEHGLDGTYACLLLMSPSQTKLRVFQS